MYLHRRLSSQPGKESAAIGPTLYILPEAWQKIQTYVDLCDTEINGFGYLNNRGGSLFLAGANDVFITEQTVSPSKAEVDASVFARALDQAVIAERSDELQLQWHSHGHGSVFFSTTDLSTIHNYGMAGMSWFVSLVANKRGEVRARYDQYTPVRIGVEIPVVLLEPVPEAVVSDCQSEIDELVTVEKPEEEEPNATIISMPTPTS